MADKNDNESGPGKQEKGLGTSKLSILTYFDRIHGTLRPP